MVEEVFVVLCFVGVIFGFFFWHRIIQFWCWLKGSRTKYCKTYPASSMKGMASEPLPGTSWIEIGRGLFRRRSAIYGTANWRITRNWTTESGVYVCLEQCNWGLPIEKALGLINTYPTLQAMLDRIAELEKELKSTEAVLADRNNRVFELEQQLAVARSLQEEWLAGMGALILEMDTDRQRYRSPAAAHIRECLKVIIDRTGQYQKPFTPDISVDKIIAWKKRFPIRSNENNFQKK